MKKRGRGIACMWYPIGFTVAANASAAVVKVNEDGTATVLTGTVETGQGSLTVLGQIAAEELGIATDDVHVVSADTDTTPMDTGAIARIEELTRIPSDVQDSLISILSEKTLPVPELDEEVQARAGFNIIATANNRDKGVNDLSSALRRRFNTVVLPLPDSLEQEVEIVRSRVTALGASLELPADLASLSEITRVVTVMRELRSGVTTDQRTTIKSPSATLSTAEAISVMTNGLALAAHFGDGTVRADDVAGGLLGAVVKDPVQDRLVWQEYLETVVRNRKEWSDLYRACRDLG